MTEMQILRDLGQIEDSFIEESDPSKIHSKTSWLRVYLRAAAALAACFCITMTGLSYLRISHQSPNEPIEHDPDSGLTPPAIVENAAESEGVYYEECVLPEVRELFGVPNEINAAYVGAHVGYVRQGEDYDFEMISAESEMEIVEFRSAASEDVYLIKKDGAYYPAILCDTNYNDGKTYKLQGDKRSPDVVGTEGGKFVFPQSEVISLFGKLSGIKWQKAEITEEKLSGFLSMIEEAQVVDLDHSMNPDRKMYGCDLYLFLLDSRGSQIGISMKPFDDGFVGVNIRYEDPEYAEQTSFVFLKSDELVEAIKSLMGWRLLDRSELGTVTQIILQSGDDQRILKSEEQVRMLENVENASLIHVDTACPFDVELLLCLENGERIRGLWCNDSCGYLGIEGGMYRLDEADAQYFTEIVEAFLISIV